MKGILLFAFLISALTLTGESADGLRQTRVEHVPVAGGAELVTVFAIRPAEAGRPMEEAPIVSVLRDTLGDPSNDRLRKVWVLTYARPTWAQRIAAAFPFYHPAGGPSISQNHPPPAALDLAAPEHNTWTGLAGTALQSEFFDGEGLFWRAPSRGYRAVSGEYRDMHVAEADQVLSSADHTSEGAGAMPPQDWDEIEARLMLSRKLLGGLVSREHVEKMSSRQKEAMERDRGHNWDLLRQRAESDGLYFEPLFFGQSSPSYAILWVAQSDLERNTLHAFDGSLLKIENPWADERLRNWKGYDQTWYFDAEGQHLDTATPGARSDRMLPLALYSLDYPPSPLILIDFRDEWKPKRREVVFRLADYTATGVLGLTGFGNWGYLAARVSWNFLRHRYGENIDRTTRVSAYAELRHSLFFDGTLDPKFRDLMQKRLDHLALNPFERTQDEMTVPQRQYAALLAYAKNPNGLPAELARERGREMASFSHGPATRTLMDLGTLVTFGAYHQRPATSPADLALLERHRRLDSDVEYLRKAVASTPRLEVAWNESEIERRLQDIAELRPHGRELDSGMAELIARVFRQTQADQTRRLCLGCLARMNSSGARRQLQVVAADHAITAGLRSLSYSYLVSPDTPPVLIEPADFADPPKSLAGSGLSQ